jgi:alkyl sulfatase BDS1-like metallo-beta-lactamase superfamily hydrolase
VRGYYGTLSHNAKAVYQRYLGWYDGNPANLNPLPPEPAAQKFVEYMGGADAVIARAEKDYAAGEYRWVAQVMNQVVFADPDNARARNLEADALEQLGYQAESGPWRSVYLQGAFELRNGVPRGGGISSVSPDVIQQMSPEMLFDYLAVRLNGPEAAGRRLVLNVAFTEPQSQYVVTVENGVLHYARNRQDAAADATVTLNKAALVAVQLKRATIEQQIGAGAIRIVGRQDALGELLSLLDDFPFWFNVVTP